MGRNSPSARRHRALKFLSYLVQYKMYGPLIGPKEAHQPNPRWERPMPPEPELTPEEEDERLRDLAEDMAFESWREERMLDK